MKRFQRPIVAVTTAALASVGLAAFTVTPASAAVLGTVTVSPLSGTDSTLFGGSVTSSCPAGTADSYWTIDGADLPSDQAILAPGNATGTGPQSFSGASIANLKSANAGAFSASGPYQIKFNCVDGNTGLVSDTYQSQLNYTSGGTGSYSIVVPARATATTLSANPAGPFEVGTLTDLTADVTPTTGADDATGSVEFFNGATSLGVDNALSGTGVANLNGVSLPTGSNSLTAVYTPGSAAFTGSTSPTATVQVNPVAPRPTTSVFSASPLTGAAYQAVSMTCAVTASTGSPNGTATFLDGATALGTAPVTAGSHPPFSTSSLAAGAHALSCSFAGSAPYNNSTSNTVNATYDNVGAVPDEQTVTVTIPQGVLTITTPYTPSSPLYLGVATLDQSDSTYSASAQFGTLADGYIVITDTRAGNLGWTASLGAGPFINGANTFPGAHAGLTGVTAIQIPGNAMTAATVVETDTTPFAPGLGAQREFARYAAGQSTGSVNVTGLFGIDQVPTSVAPGLYTSTVTFTAV